MYKFTNHARKRFQERFTEVYLKAHNPDGALRSILECGEKARINLGEGTQNVIVNGPLLAVLRKKHDYFVVVTIMRLR